VAEEVAEENWRRAAPENRLNAIIYARQSPKGRAMQLNRGNDFTFSARGTRDDNFPHWSNSAKNQLMSRAQGVRR
jgi:hypothetical protein